MTPDGSRTIPPSCGGYLHKMIAAWNRPHSHLRMYISSSPYSYRTCPEKPFHTNDNLVCYLTYLTSALLNRHRHVMLTNMQTNFFSELCNLKVYPTFLLKQPTCLSNTANYGEWLTPGLTNRFLTNTSIW